MLNSFWWDFSQNNSKGMKWLSWDMLSVPKKFGGMAFRNIYAFNLAMLGKLAWKFVSCPDSLVSRLFRV